MIDRITFGKLCSGDICGFASHSEADMAFCEHLACNGITASAIDMAYRNSGLMRDKWDRKQGGSTYGEQTISKAIQNTSIYRRLSVKDIEAEPSALALIKQKELSCADILLLLNTYEVNEEAT
ncbi:MAG: hypothetical protein IJ874_09340 [Ruminococcus sp.]|nr:hypothetical protein [Ruminococcus sp.]